MFEAEQENSNQSDTLENFIPNHFEVSAHTHDRASLSIGTADNPQHLMSMGLLTDDDHIIKGLAMAMSVCAEENKALEFLNQSQAQANSNVEKIKEGLEAIPSFLLSSCVIRRTEANHFNAVFSVCHNAGAFLIFDANGRKKHLLGDDEEKDKRAMLLEYAETRQCSLLDIAEGDYIIYVTSAIRKQLKNKDFEDIILCTLSQSKNIPTFYLAYAILQSAIESFLSKRMHDLSSAIVSVMRVPIYKLELARALVCGPAHTVSLLDKMNAEFADNDMTEEDIDNLFTQLENERYVEYTNANYHLQKCYSKRYCNNARSLVKAFNHLQNSLMSIKKRENVIANLTLFKETLLHENSEVMSYLFDVFKDDALLNTHRRAKWDKLVGIKHTKSWRETMGEIRRAAKDKLFSEIKELTPQEQVNYLRRAKKESLFSLHRNNCCLFAWGRTASIREIDAKIKEIKQTSFLFKS